MSMDSSEARGILSWGMELESRADSHKVPMWPLQPGKAENAGLKGRG